MNSSKLIKISFPRVGAATDRHIRAAAFPIAVRR